MSDKELLERLRDLGTRSPSIAADRIEALTAERDNYKLCALHSGDVVEAAEAEIERLRDEIAHLKSEDGYIQAFIEGQKAMPKGVFTIVDSPKLATLQADNARLRLLVREADDLIGGDLTGLQWKRECREFRVKARAALTGNVTVGGGWVDWGDQPVAVPTGKADT
jgi:hypothetical protein